MKPYPALLVSLVFLLSPWSLSGQTPTPTSVMTQPGVPIVLTPAPTGTSTPGHGINPERGFEGKFTPVPGEKFQVEDWIDHPIPASVEKEKRRTKPGVWLSLISVGAGIPQSPNLQEAYNTSFHLGLGVGLRVSAPLSLWLDFSLDQSNNKNASLTHNNNYMLIGLAGLTRWRFLSSDFSPFVFLGPGLAYNENRSTIPVVDTTYNTVTVPISGYEFDFLMEGGLGFGFEALNGLEVFLQGRVLLDLTSTRFEAVGDTDSPVKLIPVEAGVVLCY